MDSEAIVKVTHDQGKEDDSEDKKDEVKERQSARDQVETTTDGDGLNKQSDREDENGGNKVIPVEKAGDGSEVAGFDTPRPVEEPSAAFEGEKVTVSADEESSSSPCQAEGEKGHGGEWSEEANIGSDSSKSDPRLVAHDQSESETEKALEETEKTQSKVQFNVSRDTATTANEKEPPSTAAAAADSGQRITNASSITQQSLHTQPRESKQSRDPAQFSRASLLIMSVLSLVFFFPMGIVALYYAIKVRDTFHSKSEVLKIKDYGRRSTFCSIAGIVTGFTALLLILLVIILGITGVVGTD